DHKLITKSKSQSKVQVQNEPILITINSQYVYTHKYIYIYICMYVCMYVNLIAHDGLLIKNPLIV
ncbi:MAG: hypothetical protein NW900_02280, partial [Candidatus Blochmannia sp. A2]|nr:hypothetical protein [Candidatus Blochmannia sp. A2]